MVELTALSSLTSLQDVSLQLFNFSPADTLNAIHAEYIWKLKLSHFPTFDQAMVTALSRFINLTELSFAGLYKVLKPDAYLWQPLAKLSFLVSLSLDGKANFLSAFIRALDARQLETITFAIEDGLTDDLWQALHGMDSLQSLTLYVSQLSLDVSKAAVIPRLTNLCISTSTSSDYLRMRSLGVMQGLVRLVKTRGQIGDWYETGKETRTREFCSNDGYLDNWPTSLKAGQELKVFDARGAVLFEGPVFPQEGKFLGTWTQRGIAPDMWEEWFVSQLSAELTTYEALPDKQFTIITG